MQDKLIEIARRHIPDANLVAMVYWLPSLHKAQSFLEWFGSMMLLGGILGQICRPQKQGNVGLLVRHDGGVCLLEFGTAILPCFTVQTFDGTNVKPVIHHLDLVHPAADSGETGLSIRMNSDGKQIVVYLPQRLESSGNPRASAFLSAQRE
jgi:hypothetical protein